jgi:hypothetical protein
MSEYVHTKKMSSAWVNEFEPKTEIQKCELRYFEEHFGKVKLSNLSIDQFILYKIASNRQTRMLATFDSGFSACDYFELENNSLDNQVFKKAKENLHSLSFFGLAEFQDLNRVLFQKIFKGRAKIGDNIQQINNSAGIVGIKFLNEVMLEKIKKVNYLDIKLYKYAKKNFFNRLKFYNITFNLN